jgi:acetylornithine deacetylase/succinyl-diaminopimelate desuccinylase-like protein
VSREQAIELARKGRDAALELYFQSLRIPSVSALPEHAADCRRNADFLVEELGRAGLTVRLVEGDGHPTVYGEWLGVPGKPTLLVYGHYDVQPPDPLEEWVTPPFEPTVRDGVVVARGAEDSKGNHMAVLAAVRHAMAAGGGSLPINLKVAIEGEEEGGGNVLPTFVAREAAALACDCVLVLDGGFVVPGVPCLELATRGIVYTEVEITGPAIDVHSGSYGGVSPNPFNTAGWIIAGLKSPDGKVLIPGFYDAVREAPEAELRSWRSSGITEKQILEETGAPELAGEDEYPMLVRMWARPTLDVHGIRGGFTGEGTKTVIPARAVMKVSMRLVADQDPLRIFQLFKKHVESLATAGTRIQVRQLGPPSSPVNFGIDHPGARAAAAAFEKAWGKPVMYTRAGGSIPVAEDFAKHLRTGMVGCGFSQPGGRAHSPNEQMPLDAFHRGTEMLIHLFWEFAELSG